MQPPVTPLPTTLFFWLLVSVTSITRIAGLFKHMQSVLFQTGRRLVIIWSANNWALPLRLIQSLRSAASSL